MMDGMARPDKVQRYTIGWTREPVPCIHLWGDTGRGMKGNESPQVSGNAHKFAPLYTVGSVHSDEGGINTASLEPLL